MTIRVGCRVVTWRSCPGAAGHFLWQGWKLKNRWVHQTLWKMIRISYHTVVTCVADGVTTYVVKNECTRKKKVLHHSRLLLWLANFGEPMQMNHMCTSVTLLRHNPENPFPRSEDRDPVPGCMQYGLNFAKLWIIVNPEFLMCSWQE